VTAGTGFSQWTPLSGAIADTDIFGITDISDTAQSDDGSSKFVTGSQLKNYVLRRDVTNAAGDGPNIVLGHTANAISDDVSTSIILGGGNSSYNNVIGGDGSATVGTTTPNAMSAGTGANVSVIAGYDNVAGQLSSKIIADHSYTEIGGNGHNAIFGGANHVMRSTAEFAFIGGGNSNEVSGAGGFASGLRNTVGGQGSVSFGYDNTITEAGGYTTGAAHNVTGGYAQAHGSTCNAEAPFSRAEGSSARARTLGQQAFTGGVFAVQGDAQTSTIEMHRATTDATQMTMGIVGSSTSHQLLPNQTVAYDIIVVARDAAGTDSSAWRLTGLARRGATGTPALVGAMKTVLGVDAGAAAWDVEMSADSAGGLNTLITGEAAKTIRWVQRMTLIEVMVPAE